MLLNLIAHNYLICIFVCVINPIFYLAQGVQLVNRSEIGNGANGGRGSGVKKRRRLGSGHTKKPGRFESGHTEKAREAGSGHTGKRGRLESGHTGARQFPLPPPLYPVGDD